MCQLNSVQIKVPIHCQIHNFVKILFKELPKFGFCDWWLCCILEVNCLNPEAKLFESGGNYHLKDSVITPQSCIYFLILANSPTITCFEFMIFGWLYHDMNFIIYNHDIWLCIHMFWIFEYLVDCILIWISLYNHDNLEIDSPPLGGENLC